MLKKEWVTLNLFLVFDFKNLNKLDLNVIIKLLYNDLALKYAHIARRFHYKME
jgi:hypothetical protein